MIVSSSLPVDGRYAAEREIGRYGIVSICEGVDRLHCRRVTITAVAPTSGAEKAMAYEHYRATAVMLEFAHPNVIAAYEMMRQGEYYYFVSEFVEARTLAEILAAGEHLPDDTIRNYAAQIGGAMAYARAKGVRLDIGLQTTSIAPGGIVKIATAFTTGPVNVEPRERFSDADQVVKALRAASAPAQLVQTRPASPVRSDATGLMMDAIANHFSGNAVRPRWTEPERRRWPVQALAGAALFAVALVGSIAYATSQYGVVPDLGGRLQTLAQETLTDDGFSVAVTTKTSSDIPPQHVIDQQPAAGQWLKKGSDVLLVVSDGSPSSTVRQPAPLRTAKIAAHSEHATAGVKATPLPAQSSPRVARAAQPPAKQNCAAADLVRMPGYPGGCKATSIASSGALRNGAGIGSTVPVTSLEHPGSVLYALAYVTPPGGSRRFVGVLTGNGSGNLIARVQAGMFVEQNGSHVRYSAYEDGRIARVQSPAPESAAGPATSAQAASAPKCRHTSWLRQKLHDVFDAGSQTCPTLR